LTTRPVEKHSQYPIRRQTREWYIRINWQMKLMTAEPGLIGGVTLTVQFVTGIGTIDFIVTFRREGNARAVFAAELPFRARSPVFKFINSCEREKCQEMLVPQRQKNRVFSNV
jgi:hypothetical protein